MLETLQLRVVLQSLEVNCSLEKAALSALNDRFKVRAH